MASTIPTSTNNESADAFNVSENSIIYKIFLKIFTILAATCGNDLAHENKQKNHSQIPYDESRIYKLHDQVKKFIQLSIICSTICIQLISFGFIMNNSEDYTPLVLFSWWRNKIS